jgi:hypothetical protein
MLENNTYKSDEKCTDLMQVGISNLHTGLYEIQRGAGTIVGDKLIFGKPQTEKGMAWVELGVCNIEKAILLGCVPEEEKRQSFARGITEIKTGIDGLKIGLETIPDDWADNSNHWLWCMTEILSGMVKVGNGHNIVLDTWGG